MAKERTKRTIEDANAAAAQASEADRNPIQVTPNRWACIAFGCPMIAGIGYGADTMICRFHSNTRADHWQLITDALRKHSLLVTMLSHIQSWEWCHNNPKWPERATFAIQAYVDTLGDAYKSLKPDASETSAHYSDRLNAFLRTLCLVPDGKPAARVARKVDLAHISSHLGSVFTAGNLEAKLERDAIQSEGA